MADDERPRTLLDILDLEPAGADRYLAASLAQECLLRPASPIPPP